MASLLLLLNLSRVASHSHPISVYRQGDKGTNWYAVLSGSLDVNVSENEGDRVSVYFGLIYLHIGLMKYTTAPLAG